MKNYIPNNETELQQVENQVAKRESNDSVKDKIDDTIKNQDPSDQDARRMK